MRLLDLRYSWIAVQRRCPLWGLVVNSFSRWLWWRSWALILKSSTSNLTIRLVWIVFIIRWRALMALILAAQFLTSILIISTILTPISLLLISWRRLWLPLIVRCLIQQRVLIGHNQRTVSFLLLEVVSFLKSNKKTQSLDTKAQKLKLSQLTFSSCTSCNMPAKNYSSCLKFSSSLSGLPSISPSYCTWLKSPRPAPAILRPRLLLGYTPLSVL